MENIDSFASAEPMKQQLEIAELAKPLARYLEDNMIIGEVIVSTNSVALRREGFTAMYTEDFETIEPPTADPKEEIPHEWRRYEPIPGSYVTEEQVKDVLKRTKLSRTDLAILLVGLRVRPGIDLQALGIGPRDIPVYPLGLQW